MCNLYRQKNSHAEVASWFNTLSQTGVNAGADEGTGGQSANFASEVYPGYPGLVLAGDVLKPMVWGFPLQRKGARGQPLKAKPVNNARTDKLDSYFWKHSFTERRCIIPLNAWAEAEGPRGAMTRSWMTVPGEGLFACAGVWRHSEEWGECYSMVMTDAAGPAAEVHSRMPVLLARDDFGTWMDGQAEDARKLCKAWRGPLSIEQTDEPWAKGGGPVTKPAPEQPTLL